MSEGKNSFESHQPNQHLLERLSLQEKILAKAMVLGAKSRASSEEANTLTTRYQGGERKREHDAAITSEDLEYLRQRFLEDPQRIQAVGRNNLIAIARDPRLTRESRKERLERYFDAYVELIIVLDRSLFPETPDNTSPQRGVPAYLPDGISDMGSDPEIDPSKRSREKIRVSKRDMYRKVKSHIVEMIIALAETKTRPENPAELEQIKYFFVKHIAAFIHNHVRYDYKEEMGVPRNRSVKADEYYERRLGQCRHHAIIGQVIMQLMGITSRLLKCDADFGDSRGFTPHVANLVRVNGKNHVLDITNPETDPQKNTAEIFLREVPDIEIDRIPDSTTWRFRVKDGKTFSYRKRSNMYYRIRRD